MTQEEKIVFLAKKIFIDNEIEVNINYIENQYIVDIFYLGGRTIYNIPRDKIKFPPDLYFETQKLEKMVQVKRDKKDDFFYIYSRLILITSHNREFPIGVVIDNHDGTIIVKIRCDMEKIYEEFPFIRTLEDEIQKSIFEVFRRFYIGKINILEEDIISNTLKVGKVEMDTFTDKNNIQENLMRKYF